MILLAVPVLIVILAVAASLSSPHPWRLFAAAAVGFALAAILEYWAAVSVTVSASALLTDAPERVYRDTFFVVVRSSYTLSLALIFAALGAGQYAKERASGLRDARVTRILFWLFLGSLLFSSHISRIIALIAMPRRYVDYPGALRHLANATSVAAIVASMALAGLIAVLMIVPAVRWLMRRR